MSEVRFSAAAESDLLDIVDFIARDNPRAAREWLAAVRERCQLLAAYRSTGRYTPRHEETHLSPPHRRQEK
jgi:plasmid stabilization system protein ParE